MGLPTGNEPQRCHELLKMKTVLLECFVIIVIIGINTAKNIQKNSSEFIDFDVGGDSGSVLRSELKSHRVRDQVWEGMVKTAWLDDITRLNQEKELYGLKIEPFQLSNVMEDELYISQTMLGYQVELWMWNVTLHGLSGLNLKKLSLERNTGLTDIFTYALLDVPHLALTGMYRMQGTSADTGALSWVLSDISSEVLLGPGTTITLSVSNSQLAIQEG